MTAVVSDQANRVATVTASCSECSAPPTTTPITVVGADISLTNGGSASLVVGGPTSTLIATVKNFSGVPMSGVPVSFAVTDPLLLSVSSSSVTTNSVGVASVAVSGVGAGSGSVNVSALGNAKSQAYFAGTPAAILMVQSPAANTVLRTNVSQSIVVAAPATATVVMFTSTVGKFENGLSSQTVPVVGGIATANLTATQAGVATVTVNDDFGHVANLTLVVSPPVSAANKILLVASKTTLPYTIDGNQQSLTVTARAVASDGSTDQAVAGVPIEFSMTGGPASGEYLTPAFQFTNSFGEAEAKFFAGNTASISNGIVVAAKVQGTDVQTGTLPSNNSVLLTVGGQALSVAFGPASVLGQSADNTLYIQAYSVQVTDANNNPVADREVTLRLRPIAFSLGTPCTVTETFCSEDVNGNGSLDSAEDGRRTPITEATAGQCLSSAAGPLTGTLDTFLTPSNSDGGSVPSVVKTDVNGIAAFNLTYLKGSAFWDIDMLTATVSSNGTETSKSTIFRLPAVTTDVTPLCKLPSSPYSN